MTDCESVRVAFLDVGQGDSVVAVLPDRRSAIVVDSPEGATTVDFLVDHRIEDLPLVIVSHMHWDHMGGMLGLIAAFRGRIGLFACNYDHVPPADQKERRKFRAALRGLAAQERKGLHLAPALFPWEEQYRGMQAEILHPSHGDVGSAIADGNPNNASVVLRLNAYGRYVLLPGDLQPSGWQSMRERGPALSASVLKFPHHGGAYADDGDRVPKDTELGEVLALIAPEVIVVSVGTNNIHDHPAPESIRRVCLISSSPRILCTQATPRCTSKPEEIRDVVIACLPDLCSSGGSARDAAACPCAGTVTVELTEGGIAVTPSREEHAQARRLFDRPLCDMGRPSG